MKNLDQILDHLRPTLEQLETDRQLYRKRKRVHLLWLFLPLPLFLLAGFLLETIVLLIVLPVIWLITHLTIYYYRVGKLGGAYLASYKTTVIPALAYAIDSELSYGAHQGIPESTFVGTELFNTSPDRYHTEDLIQGKYGKTFLQLAEVDAEERRTRRDSKGNRETYYVTIFDGLLLIADFHKHFHGRTFIFPDHSEKTFGNFARFFQKMGGRSDTNLIRLEDPEFENAFSVYSTDEVEARYILSTAMMRRILDMRKRFGKDIRIGFKASSLVLAVPHNRPYLEPDTSTPATDVQQIRGMLFELKYFLDTVEELDLNTRIWTKE